MSTPRELKHYGVKGMRWGADDQCRSNPRRSNMRSIATAKGWTVVTT